ncbi:MAG TPA: hypothetical protein VGO81_16955 [Solirubrobacteraceae bacterium]|nr:hypothetical protein [Solirubrobacteraceae bacterium]
MLRDAARVTLAAIAVGALAAGVVAAAGAGETLRRWFGLTPEHPVHVPVGELWLANARVLLLVFGAAAAVVWWPRARPALDVVVCVMLGGNVVLVATALAAYGAPLLRLAPGHYVLELLAAATAAAAYLDARRGGALRVGVLAGSAAAVALLLLAAAVLESAAA